MACCAVAFAFRSPRGRGIAEQLVASETAVRFLIASAIMEQRASGQERFDVAEQRWSERFGPFGKRRRWKRANTRWCANSSLPLGELLAPKFYKKIHKMLHPL